jgi:hypothetical protein
MPQDLIDKLIKDIWAAYNHADGSWLQIEAAISRSLHTLRAAEKEKALEVVRGLSNGAGNPEEMNRTLLLVEEALRNEL